MEMLPRFKIQYPMKNRDKNNRRNRDMQASFQNCGNKPCYCGYLPKI